MDLTHSKRARSEGVLPCISAFDCRLQYWEDPVDEEEGHEAEAAEEAQVGGFLEERHCVGFP